MIIYDQDFPLELEGKVDKDSLLYYTFFLKPPVWEASKELIKGAIVSPSSPTGYLYKVIQSGITGTSEPTWTTKTTSKTTDNTVIYLPIDNTSILSANGTLNTSTSTFEVSDDIPIIDSYFTTDGKAGVQIGPIPLTVKRIKLTFKFFIDSGQPLEEYDERSIIIKITDR